MLSPYRTYIESLDKWHTLIEKLIYRRWWQREKKAKKKNINSHTTPIKQIASSINESPKSAKKHFSSMFPLLLTDIDISKFLHTWHTVTLLIK